MSDSPDVRYLEAYCILEENLRKMSGIVSAYVKRLTEDPPIKGHDSDAILKFTKDLHNYKLTCGSRPESGLNSQQVMGKVLACLLRFLQEKFIVSASS